MSIGHIFWKEFLRDLIGYVWAFSTALYLSLDNLLPMSKTTIFCSFKRNKALIVADLDLANDIMPLFLLTSTYAQGQISGKITSRNQGNNFNDWTEDSVCNPFALTKYFWTTLKPNLTVALKQRFKNQWSHSLLVSRPTSLHPDSMLNYSEIHFENIRLSVAWRQIYVDLDSQSHLQCKTRD